MSTCAPLSWEQKNHSKQNQPNCTRNMGWVSPEPGGRSATSKESNWPGTDSLSSPGSYWVAPNGTQWLCGTNLWPWLPPGWLGCYTLGFLRTEGRICPTLMKFANLPSPQSQIDTFCFPLVQSFGHCFWSLHWPRECYSTYRSPYSLTQQQA